MFDKISKSVQMKVAYEDLHKKEYFEQATVLAYKKHKGYKRERKQLKDQHDEADRWNSFIEESIKLKTELFLW